MSRGVLYGVAITLWSLVTIVAMLAAAELTLRLLASPTHEDEYAPFAEQHLHPLYFSFFATDPTTLAKLNNDVVSMTPDGFRGEGPRDRGGRRLVMLTGGSTAFGWHSTNNASTISGWLNRRQTELFFVNAGVPEWNSTQEFYRLSMELIKHKPDLVISFSGSNDAVIAEHYYRARESYPMGTPKTFDALMDLVEGRHAKDATGKRAWLTLFPNVHEHLVRRARHKIQTLRGPTTLTAGARADARLAAEHYLYTMALMNTVARGAGARRFVAILQPTALECQHFQPSASAREMNQHRALYLQEFYAQVRGHAPSTYDFWDFSCVFDAVFEGHPYAGVFLDRVHLSDEGNRIVADEIARRLKRGDATPTRKSP